MRYRFMRFPNGIAKAVTLSYDDGCHQDKRFSDVITKAGLKCTFNICSSWKNLTVNEIKEYFILRGHEIAVHGKSHRASGNVRAVEGIKDVLDCRIEMEERFDTIIQGMAYPDTGITRFAGDMSYDTVKRYLNDLDIVYARTLGGDNNGFFLPNDWHKWMPTAHHANQNLMKFIDEFISLDLSSNAYCANRDARLFYLWGHSYEFDTANNWELLDKICEKLSGRDDVWYATNMEIYKYVGAYRSLVYSANGTRIYNPTLIDVWVDIDGIVYKIPSGDTVKIEDK